MFVKICGITNEDDALFAVAMGADAVGFIFAPSPRQIAPQQVYDITRRLPPEMLTVGVFRDELPGAVVEIAHRAGVKAVQLHGRETPDQTAEVGQQHPLGDQGVRRQLARRPPRRRATAPTSSSSTPRRPGSGKVFDWGLASEVPGNLRLILAGGLDPDNVADAIEVVEPWGVDVSTGVEAAAGHQGPDQGATRSSPTPAPPHPSPYLGPDELPYDWADE